MRLIAALVLYTATALGANAADLTALKQGDMAKLALAETAELAPDGTLLDAAEGEHALAEYRGKVILVNFWATWCAPCRNEMAALDRLQAEMGGAQFQVVTVATGRNPVPAIDKFFAEENIAHLPKLRDPKQALARQFGVLALPVSVLIDAEGHEIGRLMGDAQWDAPEAKALIAALIAP